MDHLDLATFIITFLLIIIIIIIMQMVNTSNISDAQCLQIYFFLIQKCLIF